MMEEYIAFTKKNGYFDVKRKLQAKYWMYETIDSELRRRFYDDPERAGRIAVAERLVLSNRLSPFAAAQQLLDDLPAGN